VRSGTIVLVWGPPRSGTTWLYNAVRSTIAEAGIPAATWTYGQELPRDRQPACLIVKAHQAHDMDFFLQRPSEDVVPLVIFRSPVTAFQSLIRTQEATRDELIHWLSRDVDSFVSSLPSFPRVGICREEWIKDDAASMIRKFGEVLDLTLTEEQVARIAASLDKDRVDDTVRELRSQHGWGEEFSKYDAETQWHANHIAPRDYVPVQPTEEEVARLEEIAERIDALVDRYSLWVCPVQSSSVLQSSPAQQFLARHRSSRRPGLLSRLRRR
jgi:hypothetical protein